MEWFEADIEALETALMTRRLPVTPVVFYGSSSIDRHTETDLRSGRKLNQRHANVAGR
jgi:hypothetical protein